MLSLIRSQWLNKLVGCGTQGSDRSGGGAGTEAAFRSAQAPEAGLGQCTPAHACRHHEPFQRHRVRSHSHWPNPEQNLESSTLLLVLFACGIGRCRSQQSMNEGMASLLSS